MDKSFFQRLIFGSIYCLIVIFCTNAVGSRIFSIPQKYLYYGMITFFSFIGLWECVRIMKFDNSWEKYAVLPLACTIWYKFSVKYFNGSFHFNFNLSEILGLTLIALAIITLFRFKYELSKNNGKLIFSLVYSIFGMGYALSLPNINGNIFSNEAMFLFILIWSSDTFAYCSGRLFGKHKMAPTISPKKTWEGFIGGVILTLVLCCFIESRFGYLRGNWIIVGVLVATFAPLGDLVESQLKRNFNVKDSGNIIPGHGGILDRLDSFILCAPVIYIYFIIDKWLY